MNSSTQNLGISYSTLDLTPIETYDFRILRSHLLEELETEIVKHLNKGWGLCGTLYSVHYINGDTEFLWAVKKKSEPF